MLSHRLARGQRIRVLPRWIYAGDGLGGMLHTAGGREVLRSEFHIESIQRDLHSAEARGDYGEVDDMGMTHDMAGMPLPPTGGWTIGAYQCPPDPLNIHPNPAWPCGYDYCLGAPRNVRIANVRP